MADSKLMLSGCLYFTAGTLARVMQEMANQSFSGTGLNPTQGFALLCVIDEPEIMPSVIAERLALAPSTITRVIEALRSKGLVEVESEGRASRVSATAEGRKAAAGVRAAWKDLYRSYGDLLGQASADRLCAQIHKTNQRLSVSAEETAR